MKKKLLLLHGALGSKMDFSELQSILDAEWETYSFNFCGHGGSSFRDDFSIDQFVLETKDFIEENELAPADIFGYSMGGYVALKLAAIYPTLVSRLMTLGTLLNWSKASAQQQVKMLNPDIVEQKVPQFAESLRIKHSPQDWKMLMNKTATMLLKLGESEAMSKGDFEKIQQQVFICVGSEDNMVTKEESAAITSYLINGRLKIIEGFKHPIESVDKLILASTINEFFKSN